MLWMVQLRGYDAVVGSGERFCCGLYSRGFIFLVVVQVRG